MDERVLERERGGGGRGERTANKTVRGDGRAPHADVSRQRARAASTTHAGRLNRGWRLRERCPAEKKTTKRERERERERERGRKREREIKEKRGEDTEGRGAASLEAWLLPGWARRKREGGGRARRARRSWAVRAKCVVEADASPRAARGLAREDYTRRPFILCKSAHSEPLAASAAAHAGARWRTAAALDVCRGASDGREGRAVAAKEAGRPVLQ